MAGPQTVIGDGIGLSIRAFEASEADDKVLVLLTDGADTGSKVPPEKAAGIAADAGITIHTIAMGDPAAINEEELGAFVEDYLSGDNGRAEWHSGAAVAQLFRVLEEAFGEGGGDPLEAIREKLELWREGRVDQMTETEVVRGGGAFFVFMMNEFYQVQKWRWRAFGENCPYCSRLDGKVVASSGVFIAGGEAFGDDVEGGPLVPSFNVRHEPAHGGCDCMVVPEIGG